MRRLAVVTFVALVAALLALPAGADPDEGRYLVGAATRDITPTGETNLGGNGLGDGSSLISELVGPGGRRAPGDEQLSVRAFVVDDGTQAVAFAVLETIGMFVAYDVGPWGLVDMAETIADARPRLPVEHVVLSANHSHSAPDTLGPWGFVDNAYLELLHDRTVEAVIAAYDQRAPARLRAGGSEARDLVYNQTCTDALNQSPEPSYPGPDACMDPVTQEVVDARLRVLQATDPESDEVIATAVSFAAHATLGGAGGIHGDWPAFLSEELTEVFGGEGVALLGANGRVQPCRSRCAHTDPDHPGYDLHDDEGRRAWYTTALMHHVEQALDDAAPITGPVGGARKLITEPLVGPTVRTLFTVGDDHGMGVRRSRDEPWNVHGAAITTVASVLRIGDLLLPGFPGEAYPNISVGIADAVDAPETFPLGLAGDMLGYLIAPAEAYPAIAAMAPVNNNSLFNVSPTLGDHVMCADIALAADLGFDVDTPARCLAFALDD